MEETLKSWLQQGIILGLNAHSAFIGKSTFFKEISQNKTNENTTYILQFDDIHINQTEALNINSGVTLWQVIKQTNFVPVLRVVCPYIVILCVFIILGMISFMIYRQQNRKRYQARAQYAYIKKINKYRQVTPLRDPENPSLLIQRRLAPYVPFKLDVQSVVNDINRARLIDRQDSSSGMYSDNSAQRLQVPNKNSQKGGSKGKSRISDRGRHHSLHSVRDLSDDYGEDFQYNLGSNTRRPAVATSVNVKKPAISVMAFQKFRNPRR